MDSKNIFVTMTLRDEMTGKMKKVEGSLSKVRRELGAVDGATKRTTARFSTMAAGFTVATVAVLGVYEAMRAVRTEFTTGLKAIEDYNLKVASMAGFMTTFSKRAKGGDIAGAFQEAHKYAGFLVERLEVLDAKTIATGKDLSTIAETFIANGQQVNLFNKEVEDGFLRITNALKLLTAGQNQNIQMRQEIRALVKGQLRDQNQLMRLLEAQDPQIKEHIKLWREEGTIIGNVGKMLKGFGPATSLLEQTWSAIGSTMKTINDRVLRGGMAVVYRDLLDMSLKINRSFMDQQGNLTDMAKTVQYKIAVGWDLAKTAVVNMKNMLAVTLNIMKPFTELVALAAKGWVMISAAALPLFEKMADRTELAGGLFDKFKDQFKFVLAEIKGDKELAAALRVKMDEANAEFFKKWHQNGVFSSETADAIAKSVNETLAKIQNIDTSGDGNENLPTVPQLLKAVFGDDEDLKKAKERILQVQTVAETVAGRMENAFTSLYSNLLDGTANLKDTMVGMLREISAELMRALVIQKAAGAISSGITSMFSPFQSLPAVPAGFGSTPMPVWNLHDGGMVGATGPNRMAPASLFNNAPRFHNGLRSNEFPAILERGEQVIPKDKAGPQNIYITNNINAVDPKSFSDLVRRNPGAIVGTVVEAAQVGNQGLRNTLRAAL